MRSHRLRSIPKFSALPPESESLTIGRIFSRGLIRQIEAQYLTKLSTDSGNWNMYRVMRPPLSETNTETYFVLLLVSICKLKMLSEEVLKAVFPFLEGTDLASCMGVSKQWREIAQDDYLWKCICAKRWPSTCKRPSLPAMTYCKLFQTFHKRQQRRTLLPPRLSFNDLEFYIDIWAEDTLIFSEVVPGPVLEHGIRVPPQGVGDMLKFHLESPEYKMTLPVEPRFSVPLSQSVSVSVLVGRKDSDRVARIINKSNFDYVDRTAYRALAFDYLDFSPCYPFVSGIRAWVSLLFMDCGNEGVIDVFGIEMDFCDAANSKEEVLWLLDMLDWK